jgi:hypothetical protein
LNPFAIAAQGLGFAAALIATQGLLAFVADQVNQYEQASGGGLKTRRRRLALSPVHWPKQPLAPVEEDEALLLIGLL